MAYLRTMGPATTDELADHFAVTPAQILKDVDTLWVSGIHTRDGDNLIDFGAVDLEEGIVSLTQDLGLGRPLRLSPLEVAGLIAALQALVAGHSAETVAPAQSALAKLATALGTPTPPIRLTLAEEPPPPATAQVRAAIVQRRAVVLHYVDAADSPSSRAVDPVRIFTDGARWFLAAWDRSRDAARTFRLDRVTAVDTLDSPAAEHTADITPAAFSGTGMPVVLRFAPEGRWLAEDLAGSASLTDLDDGGTQLTVNVASEAWLRSLVLGNAPLVEVTAPAGVRDGIVQAAREALARYASRENSEEPSPQ
jgi:proteasome accessory factor C